MGRVKDIDDTEPVGVDDFQCLLEVRSVLKKHGMQDRFGVALFHSHLDIKEGEAFLEECDSFNWVLHLKPVPLETASKGANIGTIFHLKDGDINTMAWCRSFCKIVFPGHQKVHNSVPGK